MKFTDILTSSAHAYIVEGKGTARQDFVRRFIEELNGESESLLDVVHMEKSGKAAYTTKDASALIERLSMGAYGKHLIGVIDDAEALSETVQNKLLKTLEEPEPGVVIIISTTNSDNLLSTVKSRCNLIRISDFDDVDLDPEETDSAIAEAANFILEKHNFYEYRDIIDKKIKSQEDAAALLSAIEDSCHTEMLDGNRDMADAIELIEIARQDIYLGMHYGKALRRLCLELA